MQKRYELSNGGIAEGEAESSPILVFLDPDPNEKRLLVERFGLDEHTLNSALDPDEVSRLEFEPDHLALIFKMPKNYSGEERLRFSVASTGAFLFKDRLVLVATENVPLFHGAPLSRVRTLPGLLLKIVNRSTFHFRDHLKIVNALTDELEQKINTSMENKFLINLFTLEKSLVYFLNAIHANGAVIERLKSSAAKIGFSTDETEFLDDILVENNQCNRQAEIYSNILASLMDARVSIVSNNLNIFIKMLNLLTILIMVPTFVMPERKESADFLQAVILSYRR